MDSPEALPPLQSAAFATHDATDGVQAALDEISTIASWAAEELGSLVEDTVPSLDQMYVPGFLRLADRASKESSADSVHILVGGLRTGAEVHLRWAAAKSEVCGMLLGLARAVPEEASRECKTEIVDGLMALERSGARDWESLVLEARARIAFALELAPRVNALLAYCRAAYLTDLEPIAMPDQTSLQEPVEDLVLLAETWLSD